MLSKEAIEEIKKGVLQPTTIEIGEFQYLITDKHADVRAVDPTKPMSLMVQTLGGLIAYLDAADPTRELWSGDTKYYVHINSYQMVKVVSGLHPVHMTRREYITAKIGDNQFNFDQYLGLEDFIISVMSCFIQDDNVKMLLEFVSKIQSLYQSNQEDDGASQTVTIKKSLATVGAAKVPNPIELRPYVTFPEVLQPPRSFVFRIKQAKPEDPVYCGLFCVDSQLWKAEAADSIREFLQEQISQKELPAVVIS